jgi:hypothetical protein
VACAHVSPEDQRATPGSGAGISLAWRQQATEELLAQPVASMSLAQLRRSFDLRYLKLTGGTLTGNVLAPAFFTTTTGTTGVVFGQTGNTTHGIGFESGTQSTLFFTGSTEWWRLSGATGGLVSTIGGPINTNGAAVVGTMQSTAWVRSVGATQAIIQPQNVEGATEYDTTNARQRLQEGTGGVVNWNMLPSFNPDGGTPYGTTYLWQGSAASNAATAKTVAQTSYSLAVFGELLDWMPQVAGVGAGNITIKLNSNSGGDICTKTIACTLAAGTSSVQACALRVPTGTTSLIVDGSACTTAPIGTLTFSYHPVN